METTKEEIELEIQKTNQKLNELQLKLNSINSTNHQNQNHIESNSPSGSHPALPMPLEDYIRYGRQMILSSVGLSGQLKLRNASVMVIGAGGLGCPALLYLARAGVGRIAIVDHDQVEVSNLHRQVLHTNLTLGMNKAESAKIGILAGASGLKIDVYPVRFSPETLSTTSNQRSLPPLSEFSLVLDCTDNSDTRYLISDACAAQGVTLVSGAAIRTEGQLSVWNLPTLDGQRGPCYRCIFPEPIESRLEQRCEDEGVLGPIVGLVGVLMALEAIRLLIGTHDRIPKLLLVPSFRTIKLRKAQVNCRGCSPEAQLEFRNHLCQPSSIHQPKTCAKSALPEGTVRCFERVSTNDLRTGTKKLDDFEIIDVRPPPEFSICSLPKSTNVPINDLLANPHLIDSRGKSILFVCRRGNDSQLAAQSMKGYDGIYDLEGGLVAYAQSVDRTFPRY